MSHFTRALWSHRYVPVSLSSFLCCKRAFSGGERGSSLVERQTLQRNVQKGIHSSMSQWLSTHWLCSEWKLFWKWYAIQNLLLIEVHAFPNHHINLEYYQLHIAHAAKFVEFSGGKLIWWSTCPNAGDYYTNRNWFSGQKWCTHIDTWQLISTPFIHVNGFHWLACFAKLEFILSTRLWWVLVILL